jgi:hypothetical protein
VADQSSGLKAEDSLKIIASIFIKGKHYWDIFIKQKFDQLSEMLQKLHFVDELVL